MLIYKKTRYEVTLDAAIDVDATAVAGFASVLHAASPLVRGTFLAAYRGLKPPTHSLRRARSNTDMPGGVTAF